MGQWQGFRRYSCPNRRSRLQSKAGRCGKTSAGSLRSLWAELIEKKVFGPSTDYRDARKAAYQEYLVTTDFNVARLPSDYSTNTAAALGVAFVSATVALGVSLGFNFKSANEGHTGPDLIELIRHSPEEVPEDIQEECLTGIPQDERPQRGDWFVIWGGI